MSEEANTSNEKSGSGRRASRFARGGLSIQSKLLIMLLGVSLVSSIIVGAIGFVNGRQSLHDSAIDQLITIREMRAAEITDAIETIARDASLDSRNLSAQTLSRSMNQAFDELQGQEITDEQLAPLETYYSDTFSPELEKRTGEEYGDTAFIPESNAGKYLQLNYTTGNLDFDADYNTLLDLQDVGDGTAYSAAAAQYGDYFTRLVTQAGYEDALLLNLEGDVVFSAYKGAELGTNLNTGPYRDTTFAQTYRDTIATNSVNSVGATDFERWIPSLNVPTLWVVSRWATTAASPVPSRSRSPSTRSTTS